MKHQSLKKQVKQLKQRLNPKSVAFAIKERDAPLTYEGETYESVETLRETVTAKGISDLWIVSVTEHKPTGEPL